MGTALTGSSVASTYDALLKITDNGPVGAALKTVTDGLGNDSALQISTAGVKSTGTLAVVGVSTLSSKLDVTGGSSGQTVSEFTTYDTTTTDMAVWKRSDSAVSYRLRYESATGDMQFGTTTAHDVQIQRNGTTIGEFTAGGLDITGEARCDSLRIDAAPSASAATASTHKLGVTIDGGTYYLLLTNA